MDLTGMNTNTELQRIVWKFPIECLHSLRGEAGAGRMIFKRSSRSKQRHYAIALNLVDGSPEPANGLPH